MKRAKTVRSEALEWQVSRPIPVIVDVPRKDPGLGFEKYVSAVSAAIIGGKPAQYTVGLYGPWGSGKSSILLALQRELENAGPNVKVVTFDAWRHERATNLLAPLMWSLKAVLEESNSGSSRIAWKKIFGGLEFQAFGFGVRVPAEADRSEEAAGAIDEYMEAIGSLSQVGKSLDPGQRIVVLVDDLDRCSPDKVIEVIEAIRLLMDVPGFVFVLAIDYNVLIDAVQARYPHVDPHRFIEKIVQVPFRIPNTRGSESYLTQVVEKWSELRDVWFVGVEDDDIRSVSRIALRDNPRQIKRLLNSYMVARHIDWDGLEMSIPKANMLLVSLAMQLRWPQEFDELALDIRRYMRGAGGILDNAVLEAVTTYQEWMNEVVPGADEEDHRDFQEFLSKHLTASSRLRIVEEAMTIASDVSGVDSSVPQTQEERRRAFTDRVRSLIPDVSEPFAVNRGADRTVLRAKEESILRVQNVRSVPQTFEICLRRLPYGFDAGEVRQSSERGWTVLMYGAGDGKSQHDIFDEANRLIMAVMEEHRND